MKSKIFIVSLIFLFILPLSVSADTEKNETNWINAVIQFFQENPLLAVIALVVLVILIIVLVKYVDEIDWAKKKIKFKKKEPEKKEIEPEKPKAIASVPKEEIITDTDVKIALQDAESFCHSKQFKKAEKLLTELQKKQSGNFEILRAKFNLYNDPRCQLKTNQEILRLLIAEEGAFGHDPEYYYLLVLDYLEMRDEMEMKEKKGHPTVSVCVFR